MSQDPHDQLLLQIRGAVAEYERTLLVTEPGCAAVASRTCARANCCPGAGRSLATGSILSIHAIPLACSSTAPRPPSCSRCSRGISSRESPSTRIALRLTQAAACARPPASRAGTWRACAGMLQEPAYTGHGLRQPHPHRARDPAQVGAAASRSRTELPLASARGVDPCAGARPGLPEVFDRVQEKLAQNQQCARRHNTHYQYLLRAFVSCGVCRLGTTARTGATEWAVLLCVPGTQQRATRCPGPALHRPLHPRARPRRARLAGSVRAS